MSVSSSEKGYSTIRSTDFLKTKKFTVFTKMATIEKQGVTPLAGFSTNMNSLTMVLNDSNQFSAKTDLNKTTATNLMNYITSPKTSINPRITGVSVTTSITTTATTPTTTATAITDITTATTTTTTKFTPMKIPPSSPTTPNSIRSTIRSNTLISLSTHVKSIKTDAMIPSTFPANNGTTSSKYCC